MTIVVWRLLNYEILFSASGLTVLCLYSLLSNVLLLLSSTYFVSSSEYLKVI